MKISPAEPTTFDELKFPETVYKYREADNAVHRTILTEQVVYFAPANSFEDEFDCKIPFRYDLLTDDEIYDAYVRTLKESYPEWDSLYLQQQATIWCNKGLLRDKKRLEELAVEDYKKLNEVHGILSLTAECANMEMWKKYSSNFNGFCIGFDPKIMFKFLGGGGKVNYVDKLPIIKGTDSFDFKFTNLIYSKLNKWAFEDEYRTQKMWSLPVDNENRKTKLPSSAYTKLILGHNTSLKVCEEIIKQSKSINPLIEISITDILDSGILIKPYV